jgi:carboxyl-terminal processing protease
MTSRTRLVVLLISTPLLAFVLVGGILGARATSAEPTRDMTLRVFEDVISLILNNYVEDVNVDEVMEGAMRGLADGLDPDSAYLLPAAVRAIEAGEKLPEGETGIELTRQYYLRVVSVAENSSAARAGIRTGDYIRAIEGTPTRDMSVYEGTRLLRGPIGTKVSVLVIRGNAADPHVVELQREKRVPQPLTGRVVNGTIGVLRVPAFDAKTEESLRRQVAELARAGAQKLVIDLRGASLGSLDDAFAAAAAFVPNGTTLATRTTRSGEKTPVTSGSSAEPVKLPTVVLVNGGTSGAAELFAAALSGNGRAKLVGMTTDGRSGLQKLVKLPQGHGLWLTYATYTTPKGDPIHQKGLTPDVEVEEPETEFGAPVDPSTKDPILDKGIEVLTAPTAAAAN